MCIRDSILSADFANGYVNDANLFEDIRSYVHEISPEMEKIVKHYKHKEPIFEHFGVEKQIKNGFGKTVNPVSYTHLDVYKRQAREFCGRKRSFWYDRHGTPPLGNSWRSI